MLPLYSHAVTGLEAAQQTLNITANNIANVNTPGFDATDPSLQDLAYQFTDPRDLVAGTTTTSQGVGTSIEATPRSGQFGQPVTTGRALDVAITGDGYLQVTRSDGTTAYTRDGHLDVDGQGRFTISGNLLQPPITLPTGAADPQITSTGLVTATVQGQAQTVGQIQLTRFPDAQGLQATDGTLLVTTTTSGTPIQGAPGSTGFGSLQSGALEAARVDLGREMAALIVGDRAFGLNARTLQTEDQMIGDVTHG
jgi:flagellar basal-body rod protein FlgG